MTVRPAEVKRNRRQSGCPVVAAIIITLMTLLLNGGCSRGASEDTYTPKVLRVAMIPDRPPGDLERDFQPLLDYIAAQTGFTIEVLSTDSYEETLALFASGQVDMARFGGYSYVLAQQRYDARALVTRDVDLRFRSVIIAGANDAGNGLESLRGRSLSFGPRISTSGHVMPRAFLQEQGILPEDFFSDVAYARNHVASIRAVVDGEVDAAAANALIFEQMARQNGDMTKALRIVWTSPSYADYIWATQADLDPATRHSIREAFLALTMLEKDHEEILDRVGAAAFLPAQQKNYDLLVSYVRDNELNQR